MINLEKMSKEVVLLKEEKQIAGQEAEVWVVIDISASMDSYFHSGTVQKIVDRAMAVGMGFDANKQIDVVTFGVNGYYEGTVNENNFYGFADAIYRKRSLEGGTRYAKAIEIITENTLKKSAGGLMGLFGKKTEVKQLDKPIYVLFFTDGDNQDKPQTEALIRELSNKGIFFQFVGIGNGGFHFLQRLDDMSGRYLDNCDFFSVSNIDRISDRELFDKMMNEFAHWVPKARSMGLIK